MDQVAQIFFQCVIYIFDEHLLEVNIRIRLIWHISVLQDMDHGQRKGAHSMHPEGLTNMVNVFLFSLTESIIYK